ncbi:MAG: glutathione S-transferase N-terminal domain-containing protein [Porticoccaceae bacterium]
MITLYYGLTPNAFKVTIALEEMGLPYDIVPVDVMKGEQYSEAFTKLNPNNKIPVLVDADPPGGGEPVRVFESGAILLYLAEKSGRFFPAGIRQRFEVTQWLMWQMAGFGPMLGQAHHFLKYSKEKVPYGMARYWRETKRLYGVLDRHLAGRDYIADDYSVADMAVWPWVYFRNLQDIGLEDYPEVKRWYEGIAARPAVAKAMGGLEVRPAPLADEDRKILFGV